MLNKIDPENGFSLQSDAAAENEEDLLLPSVAARSLTSSPNGREHQDNKEEHLEEISVEQEAWKREGSDGAVAGITQQLQAVSLALNPQEKDELSTLLPLTPPPLQQQILASLLPHDSPVLSPLGPLLIPSPDIQGIAKLIQGGQARNIIVM